MTTVVGVALSIGTAYLAQHYNNIKDLLQLVFGFVNAPLFATFLLGMFWKRTTGHGAFCGLLSGTLAAALTHGLTLAEGKGGWIDDDPHVPFHDGAELLDRDHGVDGLLRGDDPGQPGDARRGRRRNCDGLVYGLTELKHDEGVTWYKRPCRSRSRSPTAGSYF